jgi:GT2 family glycosyltransferase
VAARDAFAGRTRQDVPERLSVSVVVPTVGRVELLRSCLASIVRCRRGADEILVVDQSHDPAVAALVEQFRPGGARLIPCYGRGVAKGRNDGLRAAANEVVLITDDDCTVAADWVETAWGLMAQDTRKIVTGRVLPVGDPQAVPSTIDDPEPRDYTGPPRTGVLFPNNVALPRSMVLALDGFDERFSPTEFAEDNEFCYRWLKAGHRLFYEPSLTVWHHDWRTPAELERLYVTYARGEGFLYAKHLRQRDLRILRFIARDLYWGLRATASAVVKRRARSTDPRRATFRGLPAGFLLGWRVYGSARRR